MKWLLKALAPFIAITLGWSWLENGWLAIIAYHAQIVFWMVLSPGDNYCLGRMSQIGKSWIFIVPVALSGVLTYFFLPYIIKIPIDDWLSHYGLGNRSFYLMVVYFGLIHPFLEQRHWRPLCAKNGLGHTLFAAYHVIVLTSLMPLPWVAAAFFTLLITSVFWSWLYRTQGSAIAATLTHILADFGMILAVMLLVSHEV